MFKLAISSADPAPPADGRTLTVESYDVVQGSYPSVATLASSTGLLITGSGQSFQSAATATTADTVRSRLRPRAPPLDRDAHRLHRLTSRLVPRPAPRGHLFRPPGRRARVRRQVRQEPRRVGSRREGLAALRSWVEGLWREVFGASFLFISSPIPSPSTRVVRHTTPRFHKLTCPHHQTIHQMHQDHVPDLPPTFELIGSTPICPVHGMVRRDPVSGAVRVLTLQGTPSASAPLSPTYIDLVCRSPRVHAGYRAEGHRREGEERCLLARDGRAESEACG